MALVLKTIEVDEFGIRICFAFVCVGFLALRVLEAKSIVLVLLSYSVLS